MGLREMKTVIEHDPVEAMLSDEADFGYAAQWRAFAIRRNVALFFLYTWIPISVGLFLISRLGLHMPVLCLLLILLWLFAVAQVPDRLTRLIDGFAHLRPGKVEQLLMQRVVLALQAGDSLEQSGHAGAALNHGIVHLARQTAPFFEDRPEAKLQEADAPAISYKAH